MKKIIHLVAGLLLLVTVVNVGAQSAQDLQLPLDPAVKYGKLENGLTYYIKHNEEPKNRASFYMIQNVGAILENEDQNGLAHFLEHMAFNGTEHFPGKGILNTLEKHGVAFGYNINAYTSQNETVYNLSEVPVDRPGLLDSCLLVLNDWSNYLLLTGEEIENERGVITEEWRTRRTANFRLMKQTMPYMYNNSKYAERDVIGSLDVIKNFEYQTIRDFYHDWYRTDLQAIAIVGDFDADEMEAKVIELFSKIPAVENPKERSMTLIPDNEEMIFGFATDPEADQSSVTLMIREFVENQGVEDVLQLRESYIKSLFNWMMSQRFTELLQKGEPPFINGMVMRTELARNYDVTYITTTAKTNEEELALSTLLKEVERVKRYGFNSGELGLAKSHFLNRMEKKVKEKDKISNDRIAREFQSHYLEKNAFLDIDMEFQLMQALFESITLEDYVQRIPGWFSTKNNVLLVQGPESEEVKHLSKEEAFAIVASAEAMEVEALEEVEIATSLIEEELHGCKVTSVKEIPELDAEEWTLENGAKVVYRFADYEKDNISFKALSPGGASLFEAEYVPSMDMLSNLISFYGVGDYDMMTLKKIMTGKTVSLNMELSELSEGLSGHSSPKDLEMLMQLIYLQFTSPRFDAESHQAIIGRYAAYVANMGMNPQKIMSDSLTMILSDYNERTRVMDAQYIEEVDLAQIQEVYEDRFKDASDFTFYFVGNIAKEVLLPYVEQYIGAIPSINREEEWIDRDVNEPEGMLKKEIELTLSVPKSTVFIVLNNEMDYTPENLVYMKLLKGILDLRFTESIREEEGGTYGVSTQLSLSHFPDEKATIFMMFDTDPEKADHLKELIYQELEEIAASGPQQKDLSKAAENMLKEREENRAHNSYWLGTLTNYYMHAYNFNDAKNYESIISDASIKDIKKLLKKFKKGANTVDLVFVPAEVEIATEQ